LVSESVPSIEEKYNLDEDEVNLLNTLRDSDMTSEEFINSLVDYRAQAVSAQRTEHSPIMKQYLTTVFCKESS
jgi:hypothetical protein